MKLTKKQRQIVKTIRRLHRQGEPLNITAVKRGHPELIEAVYAVKPYWGWKRALEASGLSYDAIKVRLEGSVKCLICGNEFRILTFRHLRKHGITSEEYRSDYPNAEIVAEEIRAAKLGLAPQYNSPSRKLLEHWEPLWTPEYVLDRMADYYQRGYPLHTTFLEAKDAGLSFVAVKYFHSWDQLLNRIGLNPALIRRCFPSPFQNKEQVIKAIKHRQRRHLPLHMTGITTGETANVTLYNSAHRIFGSWRAAIKAAGYDYTLINRHFAPARRRRLPPEPGEPKDQPPKFGPPTQHPLNLPIRYLSRAAVIKVIRQRWKDGRPMHSNSLQQGPYGDRRLFMIARHFFKTWQVAAVAAGIPNHQIFIPNGIPRKFPTKDSVIAEIKRCKEQGLPLNYMAIERGPHHNFALLRLASEYFGSWQAAIEAAGLDYSTIRFPSRKRRYPTKEAVLKRIQARQRQHRPLHLDAIQKGRWRNYTLYDSARHFFGSWRAAIEQAGYSYRSIAKRNCSGSLPRREAT